MLKLENVTSEIMVIWIPSIYSAVATTIKFVHDIGKATLNFAHITEILYFDMVLTKH